MCFVKFNKKAALFWIILSFFLSLFVSSLFTYFYDYLFQLTSSLNAFQNINQYHDSIDYEIADYVEIKVYEGEPCIELGESDSDFKLMITNTRIMFRVGSDVPTYIHNKGLATENIEVENELRQGGFVWKIRSNGNLGLIWKGVDE